MLERILHFYFKLNHNEALYQAYAAMDDVTFFKFLVRTWYYHQAKFTVVEEENRFKFILDPCGS